MNKALRLATAIGLVAVAALSMAQPGQGRGGMRMMGGGDSSGIMLLSRKDVQKDLALTADQQTKLTAFQTTMREEMQAAMENARSSGGGFEGIRETMEKMMAESKKKVEAILTPAQVLRLKEINVQIMGGRAVTVPDLQKELGITEEQKGKIDALVAKQQEANMALFQKMRDGELDREELQPKMRKNDEVFKVELDKILDEKQRLKLKEMGGKKFTLDPNEPMGFGGRGGGGGGL